MKVFALTKNNELFHDKFFVSIDLPSTLCRKCGEFYGQRANNFLCSGCNCSGCSSKIIITNLDPRLKFNLDTLKNYELSNEEFQDIIKFIKRKPKSFRIALQTNTVLQYMIFQLNRKVLNHNQAQLLASFIITGCPNLSEHIGSIKKIDIVIHDILYCTFFNGHPSQSTAMSHLNTFDRRDGCQWFHESYNIYSDIDPRIRLQKISQQ